MDIEGNALRHWFFSIPEFVQLFDYKFEDPLQDKGKERSNT